jgi:hypothetical protein
MTRSDADRPKVPERWSLLHFAAIFGSVGIMLASGLVAASFVNPQDRTATSIECASLARTVARRNHSMFDGPAFQRTTEQTYRVCAADPAAFRRIVR